MLSSSFCSSGAIAVATVQLEKCADNELFNLEWQGPSRGKKAVCVCLSVYMHVCLSYLTGGSADSLLSLRRAGLDNFIQH